MKAERNKVVFDEMQIANQNANAYRVMKFACAIATVVPLFVIMELFLKAILRNVGADIDTGEMWAIHWNDTKDAIRTVFYFVFTMGWGTMWSVVFFERVNLWQHFIHFLLSYWLVGLTAFAICYSFALNGPSYFVFYHRGYVQLSIVPAFFVGLIMGMLANYRRGYKSISLRWLFSR